MTYPVKYFHSQMRGAPVLSGTAGAMIGLLDACLLTGFGLTTVTGISVSGGVATATVGAGNSFEEGAVVLMAGDMPAELKGEVRALTSASASFSYATAAADGTYTGSFTAKYAPVGQWEKAFSGTNLAVYRSTDPLGSGHYLRVNDTGTTIARLIGYENMADVDTGSGPFPSSALLSGGAYWWKSTLANTLARPWCFIGDSRFFMHAIAAGQTAVLSSGLFGFGDGIALLPGGDVWSTLLNSGDSTAQRSNIYGGYSTGDRGGGVFSPRNAAAFAGAVRLSLVPYVGSVALESGSDTMFGAAASVIDGVIRTSRMVARQDLAPRVEIPGVCYVPHTNLAAFLSPGSIVPGGGDLVGRNLLMVANNDNSSTAAPNAGCLVDITGPWR